MKTKKVRCTNKEGNKIGKDGIYSYHEWNAKFSKFGCNFCGYKLIKPRKTDINKPREVIFEEAIHRMKALEARVKRLEEECESVEYMTPPLNNGLMKEKKISFIKRIVEIIKYLRP